MCLLMSIFLAGIALQRSGVYGIKQSHYFAMSINSEQELSKRTFFTNWFIWQLLTSLYVMSSSQITK